MKKCTKCFTLKELTEFSGVKQKSSWCKTCKRRCEADRRKKEPDRIRLLARESRKNNPDSYKNNQLKKQFGITLEQYKYMLAAQNNVCAICGNPENSKRNGKVKALAVDHCHATNIIRGLLCCECNQGLGRFKDNANYLNKAMQYINKYKESI